MRPFSRASRPPTNPEAGESLVELMITIAIMGFSMVAILAGIWTTIRVADYHSKTSSADTVLRTFAETMKEPDAADQFTYKPCTVPGGQVTYTAFNPTDTYPNYEATITKVRYLNGYTAGNEPIWADACPATDGGLQELSLKVVGPVDDPESQGTETVTIVKRDARLDVPLGST